MVMVAISDEKTVIDESKYTGLLTRRPGFEKPIGAHPAEQAFTFVSLKLLSVFDAILEGEARNIIKEVEDNNSLEVIASSTSTTTP